MTILLGLAAGGMAVWLVTHTSSAPQIDRLPDDERAALFARTRADLELCARGADRALRTHCEHQAELALAFRECDDACQRLASRWSSRATR